MSFRTVYGNTISEAGWRMCDRNECEIADVALEFIDTAPIRTGDPVTILGAWTVWYDRNVEEIESPVWGWSATNDVPDSNHLAGVAVDLNAPRYPWGQLTMLADRVERVRHGLELFEGTVFWGRDWTSRPDEMHYQLGYPEGDPRITEFAARLRTGHLGLYGSEPAPPPRYSRFVVDAFAQLLPNAGRP
ncbi:M15 family metallopeptidase [Nocardia terpenica]|uniref:Endolysin n=1 Tax=Nocardia terpenica TaxID=455432 RepID=A0A291RC76_9NOCA|nr:M15 family metallopeptidase [Nocardia terpenica]ATL65151.1 endolysin [Nocardia terpenica]